MKDNHSTLIGLIDHIIHTEYEISSCINSCNLAQKRALNLIDTIKSFIDSKTVDLKPSVFKRLEESIAPLTHHTNDKNMNLILPSINDTLHSVRIRLERGLNEQEMLNTFHSSPKQRKHSLAIKHAIQTRALIEKLQHLKGKLKDHQAEKAKIELMIRKFENTDDHLVADHKLDDTEQDCMEFLIQERMKIETEIYLLITHISKVKKQLATKYGSAYSKTEYQFLSEDASSTDKDSDNDQNIPSKRSIGIQTCSAQTGFKNDHTTQTVDSAFKTITLSTQTRSILRTDIDDSDGVKRKFKQKNQIFDGKNWFRQDLELPISITKYDNKPVYKENITRQSKEIKQLHLAENMSNNRYSKSKELGIKNNIKKYLTRWYFNIDNVAHCIEIRFTNNIKEPPQVYLDNRYIDFDHTFQTFRRLFDRKNWRIIIRLYTTNITIKSVNGGYYKLMIDGVSFDKLKQNIVRKQWE